MKYPAAFTSNSSRTSPKKIIDYKLIVFCCMKYLLRIILLYIYLVKIQNLWVNLCFVALTVTILFATPLVFLPSQSSLIPFVDLNHEERAVAFSYMCSTHKIHDFVPAGQTPKATKNKQKPTKEISSTIESSLSEAFKKWQVDFLACLVTFQHQWLFFSALD